MKVMAERFDFDRIGRRMPYTVPAGAMDELERNVWREVANERAREDRRGRVRLRVALRAAVAAVATVALFIAVDWYSGRRQVYDIAAVERAFNNLDDADRAYILQVYEDDLFINELY